MPLPILVAFVVVGIILAVVVVHLTGGSRILLIRDDAHAHELFAVDFPNARPGPAELTEDRRSAFMPLPAGGMAIVQSFGDGFFTRIVAPADIAVIGLREPAIVSIRFRDFTWTGGHFHFTRRAAAQAVVDALGGPKTAGA